MITVNHKKPKCQMIFCNLFLCVQIFILDFIIQPQTRYPDYLRKIFQGSENRLSSIQFWVGHDDNKTQVDA